MIGSTIEITLANGCRLRVDQQIDVRALRRIDAAGRHRLAHARAHLAA